MFNPSTLPDPDDLSDKLILDSFSRQRFQGVEFGDFSLAKGGNETPIQFIQRVRGSYRAWYASEKAKADRQARDHEASHQEASVQPVAVDTGSKSSVQSIEAGSLKDTLSAKIGVLEKRCRAREIDHSVARQRYIDLGVELSQLRSELKRASAWLRELENAPEVSEENCDDILGEVGQRGQGGSDGVSTSHSPDVGEASSQSGDSQDTRGTESASNA